MTRRQRAAARKVEGSDKRAEKSSKAEAKTVKFRFSHVALAGYLCLVVPICIFFIGWLRWYVALAAIALTVGGLVWLYRGDYKSRNDFIEVPLRTFVLVMVCFGLFVAASGNCGLSAAMYDIAWRNAMLSDLIAYPWPVYYQSGYALAYYVVFWMVPALAGKLGGWGFAMFAMWLQETFILAAAFLLISHVIRPKRAGQFWLIAVFMMFFSGLNLVGSAFTKVLGTSLNGFNLDLNEAYVDYFFNGESTNFYYRSNIDCIEECYNQIVVWLAVPLMLDNRKIHSYLFLGLLVAAFSPWATLGLIPLMICLGIVEMVGYIKDRGAGRGVLFTLREVFSIPNMAVLFGCALPLLAYFLTGATMTGDAPVSGGGGASFGFLTLSKFLKGNWIAYFLFLICEFGVFTVFIAKKNKHDPLFWTNTAWLCLIPLIWVGNIGGRDFCMDASLPSLYLLMIYLIGYADAEIVGRVLDFRGIAFTVIMTVAMASPVMGLCYQAQVMHQYGSLYVAPNVADPSTDMTTLEGEPLEGIYNFVSVHPDNTFFFKYLSKPLE